MAERDVARKALALTVIVGAAAFGIGFILVGMALADFANGNWHDYGAWGADMVMVGFAVALAGALWLGALTRRDHSI